MPASPILSRVFVRTPRSRRGLVKLTVLTCAVLALTATPNSSRAQVAGLLTTREELTSAVVQLEKSGNAMEAAAVRQRLRDGDFQVGDRIILTVLTDLPKTDTLVVRPGRIVDLPGKSIVQLTGVLRSELKAVLSETVLKYVKAVEIQVTPLTRIAVLGEVMKPGFFALRSDIPITDAIMAAGGPTPSADLHRSYVRRANRVFHSSQETGQALTGGLTLDQFGFSPGDELVVVRQKAFISPYVTGIVGLTASVTGIWFLVKTTQHR